MASSSFSYAQAAKGEAMSRHASQEGSPAPQQPETSEGAKSEVQDEKKKLVGLGLDISRKPQAKEASPASEPSVEGNDMDQSNAYTNSVPSKVEPTGPSSPSESSNTVSKPMSDGVGSITPADSDSNWEKTSQDSQHEQSSEKANGDSEAAKPSWEKSQPQMKEAPVPVVNIWQKRMEEAQAKTATKPSSKPAASAPRKTERPATVKNADTHGEPRLPNRAASSTADQQSQAETSTKQRVTRVGSNNSTTVAPPPSSDASSWPTPNLAKPEDKKKESENEFDKTTTKSHGKEKWEKIEFVPTAVFNTPLPVRGGARGGRAGGSRSSRESISRGGSLSANTNEDRPNPSDGSNDQAPVSQVADRSKFRDSNATRGGPTYKPKRSSSAGPTSQEGGQNGDGPFEKRESFGHRTFANQRGADNRRTSTSTQTDAGSYAGYERRQHWSTDANGERPARSERQYHSRFPTTANGDTFWGPSRDRGEGRLERGGRGTWRGGKSNAHNFGSSGPGAQYQQGHGFTNGKAYSEQRHNSHPAVFGNGRESRHSRTNSRSQSIPNTQVPGRFAVQGANNNGLPSLQTDMANFYPFATQPTTVMSAAPYSYMEQVQLPAMLQMQLEYYLSVENLCKDIYLRKNMDSQGFVFLHILQNFNRIQTLTTDINLIKWVCTRSQLIEICVGPDGLDRVRRAEDWQQWVMPMADRDASAQNDGPAQMFPPRLDGFSSGFDMASPIFPQGHPMSPANPALMNGFQGEPVAYESFDPRGQFVESTVQTPLTANVPDFKPVTVHHASNGQPPRGTEPEEKISDSALLAVRVLVSMSLNEYDKDVQKENQRPQSTEDSTPVNSFGKSSHSVQALHDRLSGSSATTAASKAQRISWTRPDIDSVKGESYSSLRKRALEQRREAATNQCPEALVDLFEFWAHFLVDNFNTKAYQEFHSTALEEANAKQSLVGLKLLSSFYSARLFSDATISDRLVDDFVGLANVEFSNVHIQQQRPALQSLSFFWNAETSNSANRSILGRKLNQPLKNALEAGEFALP